jgi:hypothetical protein
VKIFIGRNKSSINDKGKYGNLLFFGLILIGLMVIFTYGLGNIAASGSTIYANSSGGHDTSNVINKVNKLVILLNGGGKY